MRILIVDDEPLARARLKRLLSELSDYQCIGEAENATQAIELINAQQPEVVLLDIAMPERDGIDLGKEILQLPTPPAVIFVTAHPQHALEAYQASPADYLLKPVAIERLQQALQRIGTYTRAHIERKITEPKLCFTQAGIKRQIDLKDAIYFSAEDKYVRMVHTSGEVLLENSLSQLLHDYPQHLIRIHRRTLINRAYFSRLISNNGKHWVMLTGCTERLEASRREVSKLRQIIL